MKNEMTMQHIFFKNGEYEGVGGFFIKNNLKEFFKKLQENGLNPVGLKIDDQSFNLEVIIEKNQAYIECYENMVELKIIQSLDTET